MNIYQLLSASQGSPQLQTQGALSQQDSANGLFHQVLLQASGGQGASAVMPRGTDFAPTPSLQAQIGSMGSHLVDGLIGGSEDLSTALEALGINVSGKELSELIAQLQIRPPEITAERVPEADINASTPLDEIAARLALISSFSEDSHSRPVDASVELEAVAEHLGINPSEATQLISALNAFIIQSRAETSFTDNARPGSTAPLPVDFITSQRLLGDSLLGKLSTRSSSPQISTAQLLQADNLLATSNTFISSPQVSSEALIGSLLTLEGIKANQTAELPLPGSPLSALNAHQQPLLASAQPALGMAPSASTAQTLLSAPITSTAWPQQLGQQLVQFSQRGGEQHIQMQLNPAELGPLSISLKFSEQGAQAHFLSASAQVRQVLELAIPQLREALAEQGISLSDTSVGEQRDPNAQAFAQSGGNKGAGISEGDISASPDEASTSDIEGTSIALDGRVDLYA